MAFQNTPSGPLFSADAAGIARLIGTFGAAIGVVLALVVKLTQGKYAEQVKGLDAKLDDHVKDADRKFMEQERSHNMQMTALTKEFLLQVNGLGDRVNKLQSESTERWTENRGYGSRTAVLERDIIDIKKESGEFHADIETLKTSITNLNADLTSFVTASVSVVDVKTQRQALAIRELQTIIRATKFGRLLDDSEL